MNILLVFVAIFSCFFPPNLIMKLYWFLNHNITHTINLCRSSGCYWHYWDRVTLPDNRVILDHTLYTLDDTLYILDHTLYTLDHTLYILDHTPFLLIGSKLISTKLKVHNKQIIFCIKLERKCRVRFETSPRYMYSRPRHFPTSCSKWLEPPGFLIS